MCAAFPEDEPREEGGEKNQPRHHSFLSCLSFPEGGGEKKLSRQYSFVLLYCQLSAAAAAATCAVPHTVV